MKHNSHMIEENKMLEMVNVSLPSLRALAHIYRVQHESEEGWWRDIRRTTNVL